MDFPDRPDWKGTMDGSLKIRTTKHTCDRFSRFEFEGDVATRITTNHIERMWVELRRSLKHLRREEFARYLGLETYRQLNLYHREHRLNFTKLFADFSKYGTEKFARWSESEQ